MTEHKPRAIRRWLLFIALLHWLILIILLLQGLSKHARNRTPAGTAGPYATVPPRDGAASARPR